MKRKVYGWQHSLFIKTFIMSNICQVWPEHERTQGELECVLSSGAGGDETIKWSCRTVSTVRDKWGLPALSPRWVSKLASGGRGHTGL